MHEFPTTPEELKYFGEQVQALKALVAEMTQGTHTAIINIQPIQEKEEK
jgi:hypothetical protein